MRFQGKTEERHVPGTHQGQIEIVAAMLKQVRAAGAKRPKRPPVGSSSAEKHEPS